MNEKSKENLKSKGMTVTEITPEERARMREKVSAVTEKFTKQFGEDLVKQMYAEIEKVRGTQ
jgi:TRAP-type C4-dicarboxylate transport system substrate-binding protein